MAYDHDEQDKLDTLKASWQQYRGLILGLILASMIGFSLWYGWQYWQNNQSAGAALLYDQLEQALINKDKAKTLRVADDLQNKFPRTAYAQLAAFNAAKIAFDTRDLKTAKTQLQWAVEHGNSEELNHLARLRLATVLLEEKDYTTALKLLENTPPSGFTTLYAQRRGDILLAQGKTSEARTEYKLALDKADPQATELRQILNLKLDLIGE